MLSLSFFKRITFLVSFCISVLLPLATHAATPNGALIKGTTNASVYYIQDGKRYAFPNQHVFFSWYSDFKSVITVPDTELANYQLAGNVTYKPGMRLVKITTDPKVYTVSRYGVLRWLTSEAVATSLFGANWTTRVDDLADTFFTNYLTGQPISVGQDYNVPEELSINDISQNLRPNSFQPPVSPNNPAIVLNQTPIVSISSSQATLNQMLLVFASVATTSHQISKMELYSDQQSAVLASCPNSLTCSVMYTVTQAPLEVRFRAVAYDMNGQKFETPLEYQASLSVPFVSSNILIDVNPQTITVGSLATFTSNAQSFSDITSHKVFVLIPGEPNPILWKNCGVENICAGSTPFYRTTQLFSKIVVGGQTYQSASVTISATGGSAPKPILTLIQKPAPNQAVLSLQAPSGPTLGWSTIVEGSNPNNNAIALCEYSSCEVTVQFSKATSYTAYTDVGGKLEVSNTINVTP